MAVAMDMEGNVSVDNANIPKGKTKIKFRFTNLTDEPICDLAVTTHSDAYYLSLIILEIPFWDAPDILKITVKGEDGTVVGEADFTQQTEPGTTAADLKLNPCIPANDEFDIILEFDQVFEPGDWIEFSPSDSDGAAIAMAGYGGEFTGSTEFAGYIAPTEAMLASAQITGLKADHALLSEAADTIPPHPDRLRPVQRKIIAVEAPT